MSNSAGNHGHSGKPGGREPVDPNNPKVQENAIWAVQEHYKETGEKLVYIRTYKAEQQVVAGVSYYIDLEAANEFGQINKYEANVWEKEWIQYRKLVYFRLLDQDNTPTPIPN